MADRCFTNPLEGCKGCKSIIVFNPPSDVGDYNSIASDFRVENDYSSHLKALRPRDLSQNHQNGDHQDMPMVVTITPKLGIPSGDNYYSLYGFQRRLL